MPVTKAPTEVPLGVQHDLRDGLVRLLVRGEPDLVVALADMLGQAAPELLEAHVGG